MMTNQDQPISYYRDLISQTQDDNNKSSDDINQIVTLIRQNCSEVVHAMQANGAWLYRGFRDKIRYDKFVGTIREDRTPLGTNDVNNFIANNMLNAVGITSLRNNSLFCTPDYSQANEYGEVYIIFPFNGFRSLFSIKYYDGIDWVGIIPTKINEELVNKLRTLVYSCLNEYYNNLFHARATTDEEFKAAYNSIVKQNNFLFKWNSEAHNNEHLFHNMFVYYNRFDPEDMQLVSSKFNWEFLESLSEFYEIECFLNAAHYQKSIDLPKVLKPIFDMPYANEILNPSKEVAEKFLNFAELKANDIHAALSIKHEIMISNCKYYAFKRDLFQNFLSSRLEIQFDPDVNFIDDKDDPL